MRKIEVVVKPSDTLLHTLRQQLGLTGAKPGEMEIVVPVLS